MKLHIKIYFDRLICKCNYIVMSEVVGDLLSKEKYKLQIDNKENACPYNYGSGSDSDSNRDRD